MHIESTLVVLCKPIFIHFKPNITQINYIKKKIYIFNSFYFDILKKIHYILKKTYILKLIIVHR